MKKKESLRRLLSFLAQVLLGTNETMWVCSSGSEGVAVGGSDHHGGGVLGSDSYGGSHRLMYLGRSMAGNY